MDREDAAISAFLTFASRAMRALGYFAIGYLLLKDNLFGTPFSWSIPLVLGLLGLGSSSAKMAHFGLFILLLMALIPFEGFLDKLTGH